MGDVFERILVAFVFSYCLGVITGFLVMLALNPLIGNVGNWNMLGVAVCWVALYVPTLRILS